MFLLYMFFVFGELYVVGYMKLKVCMILWFYFFLYYVFVFVFVFVVGEDFNGRKSNGSSFLNVDIFIF